MDDLLIDTSGLRKVYNHKVAVEDLTLQVPRGEVFGFLGPNGAGKSTSIKMLLGLVTPSGGSARVLGHPPGHRASMARIGFLPEHFRFHEWLRAAEMLDLHGRLYGMDRAQRRKRIPELLDLVGLSDHAHRQLSGFSKGMLQRIGLAQALLNDPVLVLLDEPTSALDPFGRRLVRSIMHDLRAHGTTVFLNSHLLGEVELTCDRVAFIKAGAVIRTVALHDADIHQFEVALRVDAVTPELLHALRALPIGVALPDGAPVLPSNLSKGASMSLGDGNGAWAQAATATTVAPLAGETTLTLTLGDEAYLPAIAAQVVATGARLYALIPRRRSLEQLFLDVVGDEDSGQ